VNILLEMTVMVK